VTGPAGDSAAFADELVARCPSVNSWRAAWAIQAGRPRGEAGLPQQIED